MDTDVVAYYCLVGVMLQASGYQEPPQRSMTDAEVITTALVAAKLFGGNFTTARAFLKSHGYIPDMLSKSQYNRRLHRAAPLLRRLFRWLALIHKRSTEEDIYLIDSFPAEACDNIRISQTRLYRAEGGPNEDFRGYIASKKRYFFGVKIHLLVTAEGNPVEAFLTPGGRHDARALKQFELDLPEGAMVIGDKALGDLRLRRSSERGLGRRPPTPAPFKLEARRISLHGVYPAYLPEADRNRGIKPRKAASVLHSCRDLRGLRTESFSLRAGAELRRTALTHNLGFDNLFSPASGG